MQQLSRRQVLVGAGGVGMGMAFMGLSVPAAHADATDHQRVITNFESLFAGSLELNSHPALASKLAAIQAEAERLYPRLMTPAEWEQHSAVVDMTRVGPEHASSNLTTTFRVLDSIALATATPGAAYYGDTAKQDEVIVALRWMLENHYDLAGNIYTGEGDVYGGWYDWEIGSPQHFTRSLTFLRARIAESDPDLIRDYIAAMDSHLDFEPKFHSGSNLGYITINYLVQGALLGDDDRVAEAITAQLGLLSDQDPAALVHGGEADGFYPDGSFIQHGSVPYTGSYGKNLLGSVVRIAQVLAGTEFLSEQERIPATALKWIQHSFAPVMYEGYLPEVVRGRLAARVDNHYSDTGPVAEALSDLSGALTGGDADEIHSFLKYLATGTRAAIDPQTFESLPGIVAYSSAVEEPAVTATHPYPSTGHSTFNTMERDIHQRDQYAFAISRSSSRISKYETMSGRNPRPWFQGEGAYYLYLSGQDHSAEYSGEYFAVVDPTRLAGVTAPVEERETIEELYGRDWYENPDAGFTVSSPLQNEYIYLPTGTNVHSGGANVDGWGTASMELSSTVTWRDTQAGILPDDIIAYQNATGRKSWFMFDQEIVVLGAGITDPEGRALTTTFDSRLSQVGVEPILEWSSTDGTDDTGPVERSLNWARWNDPATDGSVGYLFLDDAVVHITSEDVTGLVGGRIEVSRRVCSLWREHDGRDASSLAYAIVPSATDAQLAGYGGGRLAVLANTTTVQSVRQMDAGVMMANFFGAGEVDVLDSDGPASIVMRVDTRGQMRLGLSEPTFERQEMGIQIVMPSLGLVSADPGVHVSTTDGVTTLMVDSANAWGKVFTVELIDTVAAMAAIEAMLETGLQDGSLSSSGVARVRVPLQVVTRHLEADRRTAGLAVLRGQFQEKLRSATARGDITTDLASDITDITTTVIDALN